jgi:hypothetical protein
MSDVAARIHLAPDGSSLTIEHVQDVAPILARNQALRGEPQRSDWGRHVATRLAKMPPERIRKSRKGD